MKRRGDAPRETDGPGEPRSELLVREKDLLGFISGELRSFGEPTSGFDSLVSPSRVVIAEKSVSICKQRRFERTHMYDVFAGWARSGSRSRTTHVRVPLG
jgi:hypothetical protein